MDLSQYPRRDLPRDETLFFEDEESAEMYVLLAGSLGVFRDEVQVAVIDEPLSIVGEMSALTHEPRNATVRAVSFAKLVVVADPESLFAQHPQLGAKLARVLARRLAAMNARFVEVKSSLARAKRTPSAVETSPADPVEPKATAGAGVAPPRVSPPEPAPVAAVASTPTAVRPTPAATIDLDTDYKDEVFDVLNTILDWDVEGT